MTPPQLATVITLLVLSTVLTVVFYPGVRKSADSKGFALLATAMAAALLSVGVALLVGGLVNALMG